VPGFSGETFWFFAVDSFILPLTFIVGREDSTDLLVCSPRYAFGDV